MNNSQINYEKLLNTIEKTVTAPDFYWQTLLVIACFVLSFVFYRFTKKSIFLKIPASQIKSSGSSLQKVIHKYIAPLFLPIVVIMFLAIGSGIFLQFYKDNFLFSITIQLIALFLVLRFLRIFFESHLVANLVGIFLVPALILSVFDLLGPVIEYLDSYAIKIGSVRISIYTSIKGFIILLIVFWLSGLVSRKSKLYIDSNREIKSSTKGIISKIIDIIIYFVVFVIILRVFGVDMTTFAVIGGAVGVGIGFGLQKIASNFISGIILLFEKSVEVGDLVELDESKIYGIITHFGGRYTLIETFDGREIMVPNEDFITGKVTNWSFNNSRGRVEISLNISYDSDIKKAQELAMQAAKEHPRCLHYPAVECYVTDFEDSSIKMILFFWVGNVVEGRMQPKSEIMTAVINKFRENNISIPFPQREVAIKYTAVNNSLNQQK